MKDFFDCYRLIDERLLNSPALKIAIRETFSERETSVELIPKELKEVHKARWNAFIKKEKIAELKLVTAIDTINHFLVENGVAQPE